MRRYLMRQRYVPWRRWAYRLGRTGERGTVDIQVPSESRTRDEASARHYVRCKLGLKRLPPKTEVWPDGLA